MNARSSEAMAAARRALSSPSHVGSAFSSVSCTRSRNCAAAFTVKVIAASDDASQRPVRMSDAMRVTRLVVFPVPAAASTRRFTSRSFAMVARAFWSASVNPSPEGRATRGRPDRSRSLPACVPCARALRPCRRRCRGTDRTSSVPRPAAGRTPTRRRRRDD